MILYHGSNIAVQEPQLNKGRKELDFGQGFYTTSDFEQAVSWARRTTRIRRSGQACVTSYAIDNSSLQTLSMHRFSEPDFAWLEYVTANRRGNPAKDEWDVVIGPVANDQTFPTILLYLDGFLDADAAIARLLPQKLKDQYVFKTEKALALLSCQEVLLV